MNKILTSLITLFAITGLQAQPIDSPRLIVGLTIDQLRTDYLEAFSSLYGEKGFKKLWKEAMVVRNVKYDFSPRDRSSVIASIYTGTHPSIHSIVGNNWLDATSLHPTNCVEGGSPAQMLASTVTDEIKIFTRHKGKVYSVAPFKDAAVLSAGHAADAAFWLDENIGKWATSTYYGGLPFWAGSYNNSKALDKRIANIVWTPYYNVSRYSFLPSDGQPSFRYKFVDSRNDKYKRLMSSPYVNDEVNSFADYLIDNTALGKDTVPDMLNLTYYAGNYLHKASNTLELQDTYVRMDQSLATLLQMLDAKVGLKHVLFFITSTGYVDGDEPDFSSYRIPKGEFSMKHCSALLNMYLMAMYGNGQYVDGYYGNQIYLNHKLIEKKKLDLDAVQDKVASFMMQFSGVSRAFSSHQLLTGAWTPITEEMRNGYCRLHSGDVAVALLPGWTIIDEQHNLEKVVRSAYIPSPLILLGGGYKPVLIDTPVDINCLAPTITSCLHIRAPNASTAAPLQHN